MGGGSDARGGAVAGVGGGGDTTGGGPGATGGATATAGGGADGTGASVDWLLPVETCSVHRAPSQNRKSVRPNGSGRQPGAHCSDIKTPSLGLIPCECINPGSISSSDESQCRPLRISGQSETPVR